MNDVVSFLQQNWVTALFVVLMVLMHTVGHGAHGGAHDHAGHGRQAGPGDPTGEHGPQASASDRGRRGAG